MRSYTFIHPPRTQKHPSLRLTLPLWSEMTLFSHPHRDLTPLNIFSPGPPIFSLSSMHSFPYSSLKTKTNKTFSQSCIFSICIRVWAFNLIIAAFCNNNFVCVCVLGGHEEGKYMAKEFENILLLSTRLYPSWRVISWFSNFSMHQNQLEGWLNHSMWVSGIRVSIHWVWGGAWHHLHF